MGNQLNQQVVDCIGPKKGKGGKKAAAAEDDPDGAFDFDGAEGFEEPPKSKSSKRSKRGDRNSNRAAAGAGAGGLFDDGDGGDVGDGLPTSTGPGEPSFGNRLGHISTSLRRGDRERNARGRGAAAERDGIGGGGGVDDYDEDGAGAPPARSAPQYEGSGRRQKQRQQQGDENATNFNSNANDDHRYGHYDRYGLEGHNEHHDDDDERANLEEEPPIIDFTPLPDFPLPEEAEMQHLYELNTIGQVLPKPPELSAHRPDLELRRCKDAFARYRDEHSAPWVEDFSTDPFAMWRPPVHEDEAPSQVYPQLAAASLSPTLGFGGGLGSMGMGMGNAIGVGSLGGGSRARFALPPSQQPSSQLRPAGGGGSFKPAWVGSADRPPPRSAPPGAMSANPGSINNGNRTNLASVGPPSSTVVPTRLAANVSRRPPSATGAGKSMPPTSNSQKNGKPAITGYQPAGSSTSLLSKNSAKSMAGTPGAARTWSPKPPSHTLPPRGSSTAASRPPHSSAIPIS